MENLNIRTLSRLDGDLTDYMRMYAILKSLLPSHQGGLEWIERAKRKDRIYNRGLFFGSDVVGGSILRNESDTTYIEFIGFTQAFQGKGNLGLLIDDALEITRGLKSSHIGLKTSPENVHKFERYGFSQTSSEDRNRSIGMRRSVD